MNATATAITRSSNTSFYYSFSLLPKQKREAIHTVYAFCRTTDDIVDEDRDERHKGVLLRKWRMELNRSLRGKSTFPLLNQLSSTAQRFNIPVEHFYELIRGMEMDLRTTRYRTFDELREYCYLVASSVGLMCRKIFGYRNESTRDYAIYLGNCASADEYSPRHQRRCEARAHLHSAGRPGAVRVFRGRSPAQPLHPPVRGVDAI